MWLRASRKKLKWTALAMSVAALVSSCATNTLKSPKANLEDQKRTSTFHIPKAKTEQVFVGRAGYYISFDSKNKIANWVSYILTQDHLENKLVERTNKFQTDTDLKSARPDEFEGSDYDRGHLSPAEDNRWSAKAMDDSFLMSNMVPQKPCVNRGSWKKIEGFVRKWAEKYKEIVVITGPISTNAKKIPNTQISIPESFFKVILEKTDGMRAIGFVVPNECSKSDIKVFASSVNEVENLTGFDFFPGLSSEEERRVENKSNLDEW